VPLVPVSLGVLAVHDYLAFLGGSIKQDFS
jgi:hypothetical protein